MPLFKKNTDLPEVTLPDTRIFAAMGEENIHRMLEAVYLRFPQTSIAHLFPAEESALKEAARKSALFFIGILGGPDYYFQQYGHPRMRARHMPFKIDESARKVWLSVWQEVLVRASEDFAFPPEYLKGFRAYLKEFSVWMVNS